MRMLETRHASAGATPVTSPLMTFHWKAKQGINWSNGGVGIVEVVIGPQLTLSCDYCWNRRVAMVGLPCNYFFLHLHIVT